MVAIVAALLAASCFATSTVTQHRAAATAPADSGTGVRLVLVLLRQPLWLLGAAFGLAGAALQTLAVSQGALLVVQPLLVTGLLLALPLSVVLEHRRPARAEWGWAVAVVVGLALFLSAAQPGGGTSVADPVALRRGAITCAVVAVVAAALSRAGSGRYRALLLGLGGGTALGVAGALLKEVTGRTMADGLSDALTTWPLVALALAGATGVVLNQSSYRVGVLTASQPAITIAEPVAGAALGVTAFSEQLSGGSGAAVLQVAGLALMVLSVVQLSRITSGEDPAGGADATSATTSPTPDPSTLVGRPPEEELC